MRTSWHAHWVAVRSLVDADPELQRLAERMKKLAAGGRAHKRAQDQYLARHRVVQEQASQDQAAIEVDQERAAKAAYMRDYRAGKRAVREAVDARRLSLPK